MSQYSQDPSIQNLTLGKNTEYVGNYQPNLLQPVPRKLNRDAIEVNEESLPFYGQDIWYGYEISWLNSKGKPIVRVAEFIFHCTSPNIVESKSFKLYLNSFNQTKFSDESQVIEAMQKDLANCSGAEVEVNLYRVDKCDALAITSMEAECIDDLDIEMDEYQLSTETLTVEENSEKTETTLVSHLLKSNCLITNQPDWATIYIQYKGMKISETGLLKYLVSFREHNEFHEQCVERIFTDIMNLCQPEYLSVYARYTRRGGLDINPYRSTLDENAPKARTLRQ